MNYHYNRTNQNKSNYNNRKFSQRNNYTNNNDNNYNRAIEENKRLKMELNQKANILNHYNSQIETLKEELNQLQGQRIGNNPKSNTIRANNFNNNIRNRGKSNSNIRVPSNNFNYQSPFYEIFNSGLGDILFNDIIPNRNFQRINPNFNPGDYEDYYENNNVNHLIGAPSHNFGNYNNMDDSKVEQDIIDQLYPDPDKMTYEQLLDLEEKVGSVSKGLTKKQIKKIPKVIYNKNRVKNDDSKCVVCQYDFKNGENVTKLSCAHLFHSDCVDTWLSNNKVCPMCHKEIVI